MNPALLVFLLCIFAVFPVLWTRLGPEWQQRPPGPRAAQRQGGRDSPGWGRCDPETQESPRAAAARVGRHTHRYKRFLRGQKWALTAFGWLADGSTHLTWLFGHGGAGPFSCAPVGSALGPAGGNVYRTLQVSFTSHQSTSPSSAHIDLL